MKDRMLAKAIHLAATAHVDQFDRSGKPYILHALEVMRTVKSKESEVLQAAVLHDVLEDTDITVQDLRGMGFSERTVGILKLLTHAEGETYDSYISLILFDRDAMLIKMADLKHNSDITRLKGVGAKDLARIAKYHRAYLLIKQTLKDLP